MGNRQIRIATHSLFTFPFCVGISFLKPTLLPLDKSDDEDLTLCELSLFIFLLMNATSGLWTKVFVLNC